MIIFEKNHTILLYSVNSKFFDKFNNVSCTSSKNSYWRTAESNAFVFTHNSTFSAKDDQSDESFIEYKSVLTMIVKIEDEQNDALQILDILKDVHASMITFVENNSLTHSLKLNLPAFQLSENTLMQIKAGMARLKDMKPFEDMSETEKILMDKIPNVIINVKSKVIKNES